MKIYNKSTKSYQFYEFIIEGGQTLVIPDSYKDKGKIVAVVDKLRVDLEIVVDKPVVKPAKLSKTNKSK